MRTLGKGFRVLINGVLFSSLTNVGFSPHPHTPVCSCYVPCAHHVDHTSTFNYSVGPNKNHINLIHCVCYCSESIRSFTGTSSLASSLNNHKPVLSGLPSAYFSNEFQQIWKLIKPQQYKGRGWKTFSSDTFRLMAVRNGPKWTIFTSGGFGLLQWYRARHQAVCQQRHWPPEGGGLSYPTLFGEGNETFLTRHTYIHTHMETQTLTHIHTYTSTNTSTHTHLHL